MAPSLARHALALAALVAAGPAAAVNLNFEDIPYVGELAGVGPTYSAKGYTLTYAPAVGEPYPTGLQLVNPEWRYNGRSKALQANSCTATTRMVADDNQPFTLKSIRLAPLNGHPHAAVTFFALRPDYSEVRHTFVLDRAGWKRFEFPATFTNLQSVTWVQGDCVINPPHMYDNIRVQPVNRQDRDDEDG